jgi:transcriptional regulator with XRE-family HTH domain
MSIKTMTGSRALKLRRHLDLNQHEFWSTLGLSQSGGSRYEGGDRPIPPPMQILLELAYGKDPQRVLKQLRSR